MAIDARDIARMGPKAQQQILKQITAPKESKYHNQPEMRGKIRFDSKKEARRYDELTELLMAGEIRDLKLQPEFTFQEAYTTPEGELVRAIRYRADFSYKNWCGDFIVEDVKGQRTDVYKLKRKLFREKYGFEITEV